MSSLQKYDNKKWGFLSIRLRSSLFSTFRLQKQVKAEHFWEVEWLPSAVSRQQSVVSGQNHQLVVRTSQVRVNIWAGLSPHVQELSGSPHRAHPWGRAVLSCPELPDLATWLGRDTPGLPFSRLGIILSFRVSKTLSCCHLALSAERCC